MSLPLHGFGNGQQFLRTQQFSQASFEIGWASLEAKVSEKPTTPLARNGGFFYSDATQSLGKMS